MAQSKILTISELIAVISVIIILLVVFFTWPTIQIQPQGTRSIMVVENQVTIKANVWNKGGDISGFSIITPNICLLATTSSNLTCKHGDPSELHDCDAMRICNKLPAGDISGDHKFIVTLPEDDSEVFSINITATADFGPATVRTTIKELSCLYNSSSSRYGCIALN